MEPPSNLDPLKYESDAHAVPPATVFSVPPDMKYDPIKSQAAVSIPVPPAIPHLEKRFLFALGIFLVAVVTAMLIIAIIPPSNFPVGTTVHIEAGSSLGQIADNLYANHLVKSKTLLKAVVIMISSESGIKAGDYLFSSGESILKVAWRLVHRDEGMVQIKVTIPEGLDVLQISAILGKDIPSFATSTFIAEGKPFEGYLFPDTYFFNQQTTPDDAVQAMRSLFDQKIVTVRGLSLYESSSTRALLVQPMATSSVIIMASMLEREATSSTDRRIISGILLKRLDAKMPLQVDATLAYALNKDGTKLTSADLAATSSYNTYKNLGLPPTPIGNPGLSAIEDALNPTATDYWYYISDSKGNIHYAKTYDEQLANEAKYL
jgi:UPF0755 protein